MGLANILFRKLLCICSLLTLGSCSGRTENNSRIWKSINEGIIKMNARINKSSESIRASIQDKTQDPSTRINAEIWYPKAMLIHKLTNDIINYIEAVKSELNNEAGFDILTDSTTNGRNNNAVSTIFEKKRLGKILEDSLNYYKRRVFQVDPAIFKEFRDNLILISQDFDDCNTTHDLTQEYIRGATVSEALTLLNQISNNVRMAENRLLTFCHEQLTSHLWGHPYFRPTVYLSSPITGIREEIELTAGIGTFVNDLNPAIKIYNTLVEPGYDGLVHYKFNSPDKPGNYNIPVTIEYKDQDGNYQTYSRIVKYTVTESNKFP